jgi:K+-transporting ATPase KdpF subunit
MRWSGCEVHHMTIDVIIFIILCFALFLFLLYALLNPEKF